MGRLFFFVLHRQRQSKSQLSTFQHTTHNQPLINVYKAKITLSASKYQSNRVFLSAHQKGEEHKNPTVFVNG